MVLEVTARAGLRVGTGVNTHFCFDPSNYSSKGAPYPRPLEAAIELGIGLVRERWWPRNRAQQAAFAELTAAGVGLFLTIGDRNYSPADARADVQALGRSPIAEHVVTICGPNEPNKYGGDTWPADMVKVQDAIWQEVELWPRLAAAQIVSPSLMHNVGKPPGGAQYDLDLQALAAAAETIGQQWLWGAGNFHFYPGEAGPVLNAAERERARQAFGELPVWLSETGWTQTDPTLAARLTVEAIVRAYRLKAAGLLGVLFYELLDEAPVVPGREGDFGLLKPLGAPKLSYDAVKRLLASPDGGEPLLDAWLAHPDGTPSDAGYVVTSDGMIDGKSQWTAYLWPGIQPTTTLVLRESLTCDAGTPTQGGDGHWRYSLDPFDGLEIVTIRAT